MSLRQPQQLLHMYGPIAILAGHVIRELLRKRLGKAVMLRLQGLGPLWHANCIVQIQPAVHGAYGAIRLSGERT